MYIKTTENFLPHKVLIASLLVSYNRPKLNDFYALMWLTVAGQVTYTEGVSIGAVMDGKKGREKEGDMHCFGFRFAKVLMDIITTHITS